jgi:hypothetical protein
MMPVDAEEAALVHSVALVPADWAATSYGFQYPLALKVRDGRVEVAKAVRRDYSQSGLRGVWYFAYDDVDVLAYLRQVCDPSGRHRWVEVARCYLTPEKCEKIAVAINKVWQKGGGVDDVIRAVESAEVEP